MTSRLPRRLGLASIIVAACAEPSRPEPSPAPAVTVELGAQSSSLAPVEPAASTPVPLVPAEPAPLHPGLAPVEPAALTPVPLVPAEPALVHPGLAPELNAETLAALARAADGDIQALLHPELGVWLVHNMAGAVPYLVLRDAWPERERGWQLESQFDSAGILAALADAPSWAKKHRPPDPDNCDDGSARLIVGPSDALDNVLDIHMGSRERPDDEPDPPPWLLQTPAQLRAERTRPLLAPARWARLQRLRAAASHHVVLDEMDAVLEFGRVDGRWYLLGIDGRHDACG